MSWRSIGRFLALFRPLLVVLCLSAVGEQGLNADTFVLKSGARLRGEWLNSDEVPLRRYVIRLSENAQLTISSHQVSEHIRESDRILEYDRIAPECPDTVADQWRLAEWCRSHGLQAQQREHLWRVIELNPDHGEARRSLGFTEIGGRWVTPKDFFQQRGYVYFKGKWRLPQEVELLETRRQVERQEREWFAQLKTWLGLLGTERERDAVENLVSIQDPNAMKALADNLRREKHRDVRLILVRAVANVRTPAAIELLTSTALNDPDVEVFHACADKLVASQVPGLARVLSDSLRHSNNHRVNRAAHILGRLGDRSAIPALASALITRHEIARGTPGNTSATFIQPVPSPGGANRPATAEQGLEGTAAFTAGRTPTVVAVPVANQEVLGALVKLSGGQSFGFDQRAWMNWWGTAAKPAVVP